MILVYVDVLYVKLKDGINLDRKWAKQNINSSRHLSKDLEQHRYKHAIKDIGTIERRLSGIRREIRSGKARRE